MIFFLACSFLDNSYSFDPTKLKLQIVRLMWSSAYYLEISFSGVIVSCASCIIRQHLKTNIQTSFSIKLAPTNLKFYMEHDLPPGSQNYKIGSGRISKMAAITKNSKNNKIDFFSRTARYFWHGISMEHRYSEL